MKLPLAILSLEAAALFAQAPAVDPRTLLEAGRAAEQAGQMDIAVKHFNAVLKANPPFEIAGQAHLELARIYQSQGDWWKAVTQWETLRKMAPNAPLTILPDL